MILIEDEYCEDREYTPREKALGFANKKFCPLGILSFQQCNCIMFDTYQCTCWGFIPDSRIKTANNYNLKLDSETGWNLERKK